MLHRIRQSRFALVLNHLNSCPTARELLNFHRRPARGIQLHDIHSSLDARLSNAGFLGKALLENIGLVAMAVLSDRRLQVTTRLQHPCLIASAALNDQDAVSHPTLGGQRVVSKAGLKDRKSVV